MPLARAVLNIAARPPRRWTVVLRPRNVRRLAAQWGERPAVCPGCRNRSALQDTPPDLRCSRCHETFRVAWQEWFLGTG